ncbi:heavy-metal-associated domain-containing protein [Sphingomonas sp. CFBP8993]|uniref:heavy-metal-associated domain-containing protein n=1 Tax=Sphingomonas sp. CFBP8993 TaxID=3096526 RepID=UPI002A69B4F0|nr:heavy-metal-associated domain-containing protein [Sphingomonas sp. CFBP8993]MDY0957433.1 heavy-metal-associated domain-containing protein [Sphingomonas sp. CFBP8993]
MRLRSPSMMFGLAALIGLGAGGGTVLAQIEGQPRGLAPIDNGGSYEVTGVAVDVSGKTAEAARLGGWRIAQRKAWAMLAQRLGRSGTGASDGLLDSLVSGIVIENEQIGPTRYVAKLGVLFDRVRAASVLGVSAYADRSPPMLVMPLQISGGASQMFEARTPWQQAWARFRAGNSSIDYIRPSGTGTDPLLLNAGQINRRSRGWWRTILDQYGASDVLIPVVRLYRQWPGGPVIGVFEARHGPDNDLLGTITLRVGSTDGLNQLLDTGVARLDGLYQRALASGSLHPDASLNPPPKPAAVIDDTSPGEEPIAGLDAAIANSGAGIAVSLQYDAPSASAVANAESLIRSIPGVVRAGTTSLALGGVSIMAVTFDGDPDQLRRALEQRGFQVSGSGTTLRIRRAPQVQTPALPADSVITG